MNIVFLMDPLETIVYETDTTFMLMQAAARKGHRTFFCRKGDVALKSDHVVFLTEEIMAQPLKERMFIRRGENILDETDVDAVLIRNNPPFDQDYLNLTWMLDRLSPRVKTINPPSGIRTANEKIWVTQFSKITPPTVIGRHKKLFLDFIEEHGRVIIKPTDGYGGQNVFYIKKGDLNTHVILETLTYGETRDAVIQKYIPEAEQGDKRILLLNGEPLGAVLRVHAPDDHRNNFCAGGRPVKTEITDRDRDIIQTIQPALRNLGLLFVGIDVIGGYLIEVNVTSPTGIQEMNRLYGGHLEDQVMDAIL